MISIVSYITSNESGYDINRVVDITSNESGYDIEREWM